MKVKSQFSLGHIILLSPPFILGFIFIIYFSWIFNNDENKLIEHQVLSSELSANLIAEKIQGDLTSVDLLLLLLQNRAISSDLSDSTKRSEFFKFIRNRARFYTPLDNLALFDSSGSLLISTDLQRTEFLKSKISSIAINQSKDKVQFSVNREIYNNSEELVISRMYYDSHLNENIVIVGEISKETIMMSLEIKDSLNIEDAVFFNSDCDVYFSIKDNKTLDLNDILGIHSIELESLGGKGVQGGLNNIVRNKKIITIVQLNKFSLFLGIKNDLSLELDQLYHQRTLSMVLILVGSFLLFIIIFFIIKDQITKAKVKQQAYSELENLVNIRTLELQKALKENIKLASTDSLTGLLNRRSMNNYIQEEIKRAERYNEDFSLVMCDLDHFKKINDSLGHDMGDEALKYIVEMLASNFRTTDVLCRWGGEEFLILLYRTNLDLSYKITEKIRVLIEENPWKDDFPITCSFGLSSFKKDDNIKSLIKRADKNLYKAKERRNCVSFGE